MNKLELKTFYQTYTARKPPKSLPRQRRNGAIRWWMTLFTASVFQSVATQGCWNCTEHFLSLVTLSSDLDIQTRPSEGANTSSVWIWRKSVQPFPRYFIHKQKKNKKTNKTRAKDVLTKHTPHANTPKSSPAATQWCHPLLLHAVCSERIPFVRQQR